MVDSSTTPDVRVNASAGHLTVHFAELHPVEKSFSFEQPQERIGPAAIASIAWHIAFGVFVILLVRYNPGTATSAAILPEQPNQNILCLNVPAPRPAPADPPHT